MILARVMGTVVSTRKDHGLTGLKLLLVREVDGKFQPAGGFVGAGSGEIVLVAAGSSARLTEASRDRPVDAVITGIVDTVEVEGRDVYRKSAGVTD
jgi:microcompartment protein CcmK/EutM